MIQLRRYKLTGGGDTSLSPAKLGLLSCAAVLRPPHSGNNLVEVGLLGGRWSHSAAREPLVSANWSQRESVTEKLGKQLSELGSSEPLQNYAFSKQH